MKAAANSKMNMLNQQKNVVVSLHGLNEITSRTSTIQRGSKKNFNALSERKILTAKSFSDTILDDLFRFIRFLRRCLKIRLQLASTCESRKEDAKADREQL